MAGFDYSYSFLSNSIQLFSPKFASRTHEHCRVFVMLHFYVEQRSRIQRRGVIAGASCVHEVNMILKNLWSESKLHWYELMQLIGE